jgi:hypothetical protein
MREENKQALQAVGTTILTIEGDIAAIQVEVQKVLDAGVFMTDDGRVVQPSFYDRKDASGGQMIWPTWAVREGYVTKRRTHVKAGDVLDMLSRITNSNKYAELKTELSKRENRLARVRSRLKFIAENAGAPWERGDK